MIFRRKIYDKLLAWKEEAKGKKALLIEGAHRIGKYDVRRDGQLHIINSILFFGYGYITHISKRRFIDELGIAMNILMKKNGNWLV